MSLKHSIASWIARKLLSYPRLRVHFAHRLLSSYFDDLHIEFRLKNDLRVPLKFSDSSASFSEIFLMGCYDWIPMDWRINRWLDLGSNNGYFSLFMIDRGLQREEQAMQALLVDGDERSRVCMDAIRANTPSSVDLDFLYGVVGPEEEEVSFEFRRSMGSSIGAEGASVKVWNQEEILSKFPPPYDLIKADIEGAESQFLANYGDLLSHTDRLIIEWHSWNPEGVSTEAFEKQIRDLGFEPSGMNPKRWESKGQEYVCVDYSCVRPGSSSPQ